MSSANMGICFKWCFSFLPQIAGQNEVKQFKQLQMESYKKKNEKKIHAAVSIATTSIAFYFR